MSSANYLRHAFYCLPSSMYHSLDPYHPAEHPQPGKHNHPHWQGKYFPLKDMRERWTATGEKSLSYDHLITVVLVKDPLNWMSSMCRNRYVAHGPWWRGPKCPMLLSRNAVRPNIHAHLAHMCTHLTHMH